MEYPKDCIGHGWKSKKNRKQARGSQTPGRTKVESCKAGPLKKYLAKNSRSYKSNQFSQWHEIFNKR